MKDELLQEFIQLLDSLVEATEDGNLDEVYEQLQRARRQYEKELMEASKNPVWNGLYC